MMTIKRFPGVKNKLAWYRRRLYRWPLTWCLLKLYFSVFIWMNLDWTQNLDGTHSDGLHCHDYHGNVNIYIWYNISSGNRTISEWKCSNVTQNTYIYIYFIYDTHKEIFWKSCQINNRNQIVFTIFRFISKWTKFRLILNQS